nr:type II toxin-antitoxin system VapC family toxin [uncultured Campylobacter sp.]
MYLLDTHVLLWYFMGSEKLGNRAKNTIEKNLFFYSTATLWELGIKQSINKIDLKLKISELENIFIKSAFLKLEINAKQIDRLKNLADIHKDPFDRLLIAQALKNNLCLITADENILLYDIKTLDARK